MITEDYCDFETAKLLKDKGFDEPCYVCYIEDEISYYDYCSANHELIEEVVAAPTLQMAMKWLRELKAIHICVKPNEASANCKYFAMVIATDTKWGNIQDDNKKTIMFDTYEEACEAAIKYCLENLI